MSRELRTQLAAVCLIVMIVSGIGLYRIHLDEKERAYRNERVTNRFYTPKGNPRRRAAGRIIEEAFR